MFIRKSVTSRFYSKQKQILIEKNKNNFTNECSYHLQCNFFLCDR